MLEARLSFDHVREHLGDLDMHKSLGPDGMHQQALRELRDTVVRLLTLIFGRSWQSWKVPGDWNVTSVFRRGKKEDPGSHLPVSLTSVLERWWSSSFWRPSLTTGVTRRWSRVVSMDSQRIIMLDQLDCLLWWNNYLNRWGKSSEYCLPQLQQDFCQ